MSEAKIAIILFLTSVLLIAALVYTTANSKRAIERKFLSCIKNNSAAECMEAKR